MPELMQIPIHQLAVSDINPRKAVEPENIDALAQSIEACGLLQNLSGLRVGENVMIVAGGRRLRALSKLLEAGKAPDTVPVLVTDDEYQARAWAMAENTARTDLNPADEVAAYSEMAQRGIRVPTIAAAFGVSENHVARRLKLATLSDAAITALREGKINISQAGALTLCQTESQQTETLDMALERGDVSADRLRNSILSGRVRSTERSVRFVGLDTYRYAGGAVSTDLFSEDVTIEDETLLDELFSARVDAVRDELIASGWKWAEFVEGTYLASWELERGKTVIYSSADDIPADDRKVAGVYFCIDGDGKVQVSHRAMVRAEDKSAAIEAGVIADDRPKAADGTVKEPSGDDPAALSAALLADLRAVRLAALQAALLKNPVLALSVLAYGLSSGGTLRPLELIIRDQTNAPTAVDGFHMPDALQQVPEISDLKHAISIHSEECEEIIINRLVRAIIYGFGFGRIEPEWADLFEQAEPDIRAIWRPTKDGFFSRAPSSYLDSIYFQIFNLDAQHADAREFAKMKKGEKARVLHMLFDPDGARKAYRLMSDTALARIEAWIPEID